MKKLEVHEHSYVTGPNANIAGRKVVHSHEGGNVPHEHEHTGPSVYTIDKDEWFLSTGLRGGGRKKFTAKPDGVHMESRPLHPDRLTYEIIVVGPPSNDSTGPGLAVPERLRLAHGLRPHVVKLGGAA